MTWLSKQFKRSYGQIDEFYEDENIFGGIIHENYNSIEGKVEYGDISFIEVVVDMLHKQEELFFEKHYRDSRSKGLTLGFEVWFRYYIDRFGNELPGHYTIRFPLHIWKKEDFVRAKEEAKRLFKIIGWDNAV